MTPRTTIFRTDGRTEVQEWPETVPSLEWLQKAVGGYIELVRFPDSREADVWANEEGLLRGLLPNLPFLLAWGRYPYASDGMLRGDVVVCEGFATCGCGETIIPRKGCPDCDTQRCDGCGEATQELVQYDAEGTMYCPICLNETQSDGGAR